MGTFSSGVWGGAGVSGGGGTVGVPLSSILQPMLRIAGITTLPGTTPNDDQFGELVPLVNDMLASYSLDGHKVYSASIDQYALTAGQKVYTIGSGGDLDNGLGAAARPLYIKEANILFPTSPVVRRPVYILDDDEWASIAVQDIPGAPPYQLYYDGGYNSAGLGSIYLRFQPPTGYILELYTWQALQSTFAAPGDTAVFPPGYVEMIKWNGALRVAAMYPLESKISPIAADMARRALQAVRVLNTSMPKIGCDAGFESRGDDGGDGFGWLDGNIR